MKKLTLLLLLVCMMAVPLQAQEPPQRTLISGGIEHGGFGGPVVKFTEINDAFEALAGWRFGWIIDHTFAIGCGGYGLVHDSDIEVRPYTSYDWGTSFLGFFCAHAKKNT